MSGVDVISPPPPDLHATGTILVPGSRRIVPEHVFNIAAGTVPEADHSLERAGAFVRDQLGP